MEKTHIQIDMEVKKELEVLRDKFDLVSMNAVVKRLLKYSEKLKG